jgi:hypothetical protein
MNVGKSNEWRWCGEVIKVGGGAAGGRKKHLAMHRGRLNQGVGGGVIPMGFSVPKRTNHGKSEKMLAHFRNFCGFGFPTYKYVYIPIFM